MKNVVTLLIALGALALFGCEGKSETAKPVAKPDPAAAAAPGAAAPAAPAGSAKPAAGGW